jgi:hypothetical protein
VTNKWLKAGYGEPLRRFFSKNSVFEQIIDFGHAPIFEDADTFPCIVSVRKPIALEPEKPEPKSPVLICPVPREKLADINLMQYVQQEGYEVPWSRLSTSAWSLESPAVDELIQKIRRIGVPLKDFASIKPFYGIKTGLNEAFLVDAETKRSLISRDPNSTELLKPFLRGRDIKRWHPEWDNLWMIFIRWDCPIENYPAILTWLEKHKVALEMRPEVKQGRFPWYALSRYGADYWQLFEQPKINYQVIQYWPQYSLDESGAYGNDKTYFLPSNDLCLLGWLNSPLLWWHNWRHFGHMKDEALNPANLLMENVPIVCPKSEIRSEVEPVARRLIDITKSNQKKYPELLDWLRVEHDLDKPGEKLEKFASLDCDQFVQEVKKRKPKAAASLSPKALKELREAYNDYAPAIQTRNTEALKLEHRLSDLVNQAYGLTPEEIDLMWKTAPPRMPITRSISQTTEMI